MTSKIFLYWASGSPPCWRVMLTLEEKGLAGYGNKLLEMGKNEHKSEEVLKWNPRGQVPTFIYDNDIAINESIAACEFLESLYGKQGTPLTPEDPKKLALMLQRKGEVFNLQDKVAAVLRYKFLKRGASDFDVEKAKEIVAEFFEELNRWEKYAGQSDYIAGDVLTLADLCVFPCLAIAVRFQLDLPRLAPNLSNYYDRMKKLPSVEKTWPPHWKTTPNPPNIWE